MDSAAQMTGCRPAGGSAYWQPEMSNDPDASDEALMLGYRGGDAGAFDRLYDRHKGGVYRYLLRQCRNAAVADELFQDVWMNLIRARDTYTVQARFATYLYRIAHNRVIDHFRRPEPAAVPLDEDHVAESLGLAAPRWTQPDVAADARAQATALLRLLDDLPAEQREAFVLQQETGLSIEEIAEMTGVAHETAKSRLRYALSKLRRGMQSWR